jgi:hypothetical protein
MKLERSLTALALAGVLALSGCGNNKDNGNATVGDSASSSVSDSPSASDTQSPSGTGEVVDNAEFLADLQRGMEGFTTAHLTMQAGTAAGDMSGEGDIGLSGGKLAMAMTMSMPALGAGDIDVRLVDGFMYMKMPQLGGKFMKVNLADPKGPLASLGQLTDAFDPSKSLDMFAEGLTRAVYLGKDDLDGENLDHYQLTMDTTKIAAFKNLPRAANIPKTMTYEIWFDGDFQMRGMDADLPTGKTKVRYTHLGEPVDIKAPPASEVTKMPGM